jgi:hypothetical protein
MFKTARIVLVSAAAAAAVASPAFAQSSNSSNSWQANVYDVVSPSQIVDSFAFDPARTGGGSIGYDVTGNDNY